MKTVPFSCLSIPVSFASSVDFPLRFFLLKRKSRRRESIKILKNPAFSCCFLTNNCAQRPNLKNRLFAVFCKPALIEGASLMNLLQPEGCLNLFCSVAGIRMGIRRFEAEPSFSTKETLSRVFQPVPFCAQQQLLQQLQALLKDAKN